MLARRLFVILLCTVFVLPALTSISAQEEAPQGLRYDAPPYAVRGAYTVGTRDFVIDPEGNEPLTISVWYPAQPSDAAAEPAIYDYGAAGILPDPMNYVTGTAIRDAAFNMEQSPYPLVVFSPGMGASRFFTAYLFEQLASRGFVVITLDQVGTRLVDLITLEESAFAEQIFLVQARRPVQMRRALDYAETLTAPDGDLAGMINLDRIAVGGYSAGGWTALVLAGGQIHLDYLRDWCAQSIYASAIISVICARSAQGTLDADEQHLLELAGVEAEVGAAWSPVSDVRVDAILTIAPGGVLTFGEDGLQDITVPALILYGSDDPEAIPQYNAVWGYEHLGSANKGLVTLEGGGHMMYGQCNAVWTMNTPNFCLDAVWDVTRVHDLTNHFATAFLMAELYGDADAAAALTPEAMQFPGVEYQTTGF